MTSLLIRLFIKDHKNTKSATVRAQYGTLAGAVGILTNLIVAAVKFIIGLIAGSVSVMADATNNFSDAGSSLVTMVGFKLSGKPADRKHPFGHARIEYLTGLIVSFIIVMLGFAFLTESIGKIINKSESNFTTLALIILGISIAAKLWQGFFYRSMAGRIGSDSLKASAQDSFNDVISSAVVLIGALVGKFTTLEIDGYVGVAVAIFILVSGVKLVIETADPLLGVPPEKETVEALSDKILSYDGVVGVHDLIIHSYGANRIFCSVHAEVPADVDVMLSHDIIDNIEEEVYQEMGISLVIHLDPITVGDKRIDEMKATLAKILAETSVNLHYHDFRAVFGVTHDNVLFDLVLPMDFSLTEEEITSLITKRFTESHPKAIVKIKIDRDMNDML